jgi:hypothetical protein
MENLSINDFRAMYLASEYIEDSVVTQTLKFVQAQLDPQTIKCSIDNTMRRIALTLNENAGEDLI